LTHYPDVVSIYRDHNIVRRPESVRTINKMKLSIKSKILSVIMGFLIILFAGFLYLIVKEANKTADLHNMEGVAHAKKSFDILVEEETRMMKLGLLNMMENNDIKKIFLEKDRQKLYEYVKPFFDQQKDNLGITHWLFHEPDKNVFLRVHSPDLFGMPTQERKTITHSEKEKSWGVGVELGAVGFAQRVVHPYYDGNELIGYVEYGEDIAPLLERMKGETGDNVAMVAKKSSINADQWKSFRESKGLRNNYDDMPNFVMLGTTNEMLVDFRNNCFTEQFLNDISETGGICNRLKLNGRSYVCGGFPMIGADGEKVGAVLVVRDTTDEIATTNKSEYTIFTIAIFATILIAFAIIVILNKIIVLPLERLRNSVEEINEKNLTTFIKIDSYDEIGRLASAFNGMNDRIEKSYLSLEEKIREKTAELTKILNDTVTKNRTLESSKKAMFNILEDFDEGKKEIAQKNTMLQSALTSLKVERDRGEGILRYLHSIGEGVMATDTDGVLTFINLAAAKMSSHRKESPLIGKKYLDEFPFFIGSGSDAKLIDPAAEAIKSMSVYVLPRECYLSVHFLKIYVSGSFSPIIKDGKVLGVVSVFQDITERHIIDKEKDDFLSVAAHQLRTPLAGIRWEIEMLLEGDAGELPAEAKELLDQIFENNQRLVVLVNDLLDVSRINMGKSKEDVSLVDVCGVMSESIKSLDGLAKERKINISFEKECVGLPRVKMGPKHLFNAIENLISNAIKYTPSGGNVTVKAELKGEKVLISVTDTGIGIPEKDQEKIFKKFFRASNAALKETEGSGLGLNVVKSFIEEASGKIWFESQEGKGTTFIIELPGCIIS
jgi:signal transduction histidine kinase